MRAFNPTGSIPPWRWMIYSDRFTRGMEKKKGLLFHLGRGTKERPLNMSLSFERVRDRRTLNWIPRREHGNAVSAWAGRVFKLNRVRLIRARMHSRRRNKNRSLRAREWNELMSFCHELCIWIFQIAVLVTSKYAYQARVLLFLDWRVLIRNILIRNKRVN